MPTRSDNSLLDWAWSDLFATYPASFAVTLAYNPTLVGTVFPAYRLLGTGERIRLPMPALKARSDVRQLATSLKVSCERIQSDLDRLHRNMDRKLFGARFHKLPTERRTAFMGFIENLETNAHVHLSWRVPGDRLEEFAGQIQGLWLKTTPHGSIRIKPIEDAGWGSYSTKRRPALKDPELFVANRT